MKLLLKRNNWHLGFRTFPFVLALTLAYMFFGSQSSGQNEGTQKSVQYLLEWIETTDNDKSLLDRLKDKISGITGLVLRDTSPDMPPKSRRLWIVSADGKKKQLVSNDTGVRHPRWGRMGYLAYEVETDTNNDGYINFHDNLLVRIVPATGGSSKTIGPGRSPVWSPDGMHVAFVHEDEVWIHKLGGDVTPLGQTSLTGKLIVTDKPSLALSERFWTIDLSSKKSSRLPEDLNQKYIWLGSISSSGSKIAFYDAMRTDIFVQEIGETGAPTNVTRDEFSDIDPAWSPDDRFIVYVSDKRADNGR